MRRRSAIEADAAAFRDICRYGYVPSEHYVTRLLTDIDEMLAEIDIYKATVDDVHPVALRFGREYNADNPSAMAQDIWEHVTSQLRAERQPP